ncbi:RAB6-interacting golgin [Xenentodon cancila]
MSGWSGFSDEELRRLQKASIRGRRPPAAGRSRQQLQRERALQLARSLGLPPEQQLSTPPLKEGAQSATGFGPAAVEQVVQRESPLMKPNENHQLNEEEAEVGRDIKELEKREVELREKTRLEQLQLEQKLIEERNKRKKALLAKTIAEKSKQTQAEAVKLRRIQKELQALDDMVSNDIGILRGKIEQASWDYSAARKRYEKAETEYVTAKLDLHRRTEVKEQLTEHLCAIIQQNELRKAHKLEELMEQLQLQATEDELQEDMPGDGRGGNASAESREGTVQSSKDATVEETADQQETIQPVRNQQDYSSDGPAKSPSVQMHSLREFEQQSSTSGAPPAQLHQRSSTSTAPPAELHQHSSISRAPSAELHQHSSTSTAPPAQLHQHSSTSTAPSAQLHQHSSISTAPSAELHQHCSAHAIHS